MTPEQWKDEFQKELDALREPIDRLCALITLTPKYYSHECLIRQVFATLVNEQENDVSYRIDASRLERLYHLLKHLPRPAAEQDYCKKHNALSEILQFALGQILSVYIDEGDSDDLVLMCQHWQELLNPLENEIGYEQELARLIAEMTPNLTKSEIARQIRAIRKPAHYNYTLLNVHPWNMKARELLAGEDGIYYPSEALHILKLMNYGLNNKGEKMRKIRRELEKRCGMYELEWKPAEMARWRPIQAMFYITSATDYNPSHYLPGLMESETALEGAIALLYHLVDLMEYRHEI
ncbi:MAG: hypothetical protein OXM61_10995 [Candidatus Poribacteria bacterium]|nr:hypothetical protein [Candidatus Poribacteria bacterium]